MPGKRKRDEDADDTQDTSTSAQTHGATVFISNLPYTATSTDLKTLFSDVAPVKNAFVVLEKETKVSKGVGYVTFAMREDATQCVANGTVDMNGRALRVDWAGAKPKPGEESSPQTPKHPRRVNIAAKPKNHDQNAIRTITITGLPDGIDSKVLWKKVRKQDGAESVVFPALREENGSEDPKMAHVLFDTTGHAQQAVERLNAHIFKGSVLGVTLKKRLDKRPNGASRLIVRNLPWDITESDLRSLFLPYGAIFSITIPVEASNEQDERPNRKPKAKGFAFVWMLTKADAEKALEGTNGKTVKERPIAVDWALSKDKWETAKGQIVTQDEDLSDTRSNDSAEDDDSDGSDEALGVHSDGDASMHSFDGHASDSDDDKDRGDPARPELPAPEAGTTLFIRNVPWEASEDDVRQLLRTFGPLRYVRIVMDNESQRSKGSAFACFWNKEDADKVISVSEELSKEAGIEQSVKNPFSMPSMLAPDPSSSLARSLVLNGRTLDIVRAVTRETANKLRDAGEKMREKADKRNLYLMREGVIFPNSPAASSLPSAELEKRINSFNARRALLRSNPSLYVSKTRLSIRQIPIFATERCLRRLALHSVREFDKEVNEDVRDPLADDEIDDESRKVVADPLMGDDVRLPQRQDDGPNATSGAGRKPTKKSKGKTPSRVKQAKVVRITDKVDTLTGKGRSKGYGFLEMERHSDALKVLRWANNNPDVGALLNTWWLEEMKDMATILENKSKKDDEEINRLKRLKDTINGYEAQELKAGKRTLIVEFSIENVLIVKKRQGRDAAPTVPRTNKGEADSTNGPNKDINRQNSSKGGKGKKQRGGDDPDSRPSKRVKRETSENATSALADRIGDRVKPENTLGSIIGRKRRMKKGSGRK